MIGNEALVKFANQDACDRIKHVRGGAQMAEIARENVQLGQECTTSDLPNDRKAIKPILVAH